jgi:hypothetical protein
MHVGRQTCAFVLGAIVAATSAGIACAQRVPNVAQFLPWGTDVANSIVLDLQLPGQALFAETAHADGSQSGGWNGKAFAWPHSAEFRVLNSLTRYNPAAYSPVLRQFADQFHAAYWTAFGGGYVCCAGGGDRFYDDNSHLAVALAEAYEITGDQVYLNRAAATFDFLLTGEAPGANGGSYWSVQDHSFLDTSAALQGARAALMLYKATGTETYLQAAHRRYDWAKNTTQLPSGTFLEKLYLTGPKANQAGDFDLVHYAGYAIAANALFYDVTGGQQYLTEAQRIASASLSRYFDPTTGRIGDEGFWAYELVDGLDDLYQRDHNPTWLSAVAVALQWLHDNKQDAAGHYGRFWGRNGPQIGLLTSWDLNDQAPVARAYLHTALLQVPPISGGDNADFDHDGDIDGADFLTWQRGLGLNGQLNRATGDANGDGSVLAADFAIWKSQFGDSPATTLAAPVPEPTGSLLAMTFLAAVQFTDRRPTQGAA